MLYRLSYPGKVDAFPAAAGMTLVLRNLRFPLRAEPARFATK